MNRRRSVILVFALLAAAFVVGRVTRPQEKPEEQVVLPEPRPLDVQDVITYSRMKANTLRIRSARDVMPGGYSAAMLPLVVDWENSELVPGGSVVVKNINDGGNPVSGVTVLRSARVHFERVTGAEFILVPLGGPKAFSHGQLRFIFEKGGAEFLGNDNADTVGEADELSDLVFSWEAWRTPGAAYDVMEGMDDKAYKLSLRAYSGRQRFLEDALGRRDWKCFTLQLPGGRRGLTQLFLVGLALGDGAARNAIWEMLNQAEEAWLDEGPTASAEEMDAVAHWQMIRDAVLDQKAPTEDPRLKMEGRTGYQTLIRSCATLALYNVDVAVQRLIEQDVPHEGMRPMAIAPIDEIPDWMREVSTSNLAGVFARAPAAIDFFKQYPSAIPSEIPKALDEAGLLVHEGGKPRVRDYTMNGLTPWGHRDQLLIR